MTAATHTPGPWVDLDIGEIAAGEDYAITIAIMNDGGNSAHALEVEANARLIAAAPDLFDPAKDAIEILEVAIDLWNSVYPDEPDEVFTDLQRRFREATAKATGQ